MVTGGDHWIEFSAEEMWRSEIDKNTTMVSGYIVMKRFISHGENGGFGGRGNENIVDPFGSS
jgi:hypothetical protein